MKKTWLFIPSFLSVIVASQSKGITETDWPKKCGHTSDIPTAKPAVADTPKVASTKIETPYSIPTYAPVIHDNPSVHPAQHTNHNGPFSDPSANSAHPEASASAYSQREQSQGTDEKPDADVHFGNLTFYTVGVGACGQDSTGQDDTGNIIALSSVLFDAARIDNNPNNNPICGKTVTMKGSNGKMSYGTILDRCEGCQENDIDVSRKVFKDIWGSLDQGRTDIQWWYS